MGKLIQQFMKFGVVGIIAFGIDYGLLAFLTEVFGINYLVSSTISFTVSVVFNYVASMRYVFTHKEGMSKRREFVIFVVLSVIGLGINNLCMWAGVELLHIHYLITKIGATAIVSIWNFVTRKIFLDAGDAPQQVPPAHGEHKAPGVRETDCVDGARDQRLASEAATGARAAQPGEVDADGR